MKSFKELILKANIRFSDWLILLVFFILLTLSGFYLPQITNQLFNAQSEIKYNYYLLCLVGIYLAQYILRIFYQAYISFLSRNAIANYRSQVFTHWLLDRSTWNGITAIDKYSVGEIQARLLTDTNALKEAVDNGSMTIVFDFVFVLACSVSFILIDFKLGISFFVLQFFIVYALLKISKALAPTFHEVRKSYSGLTKDLTDTLKGIAQIFKIQQNNYVLNRLKPSQENFLKVQLKANFYDASYFAFAESLFPLFLAFLVLIFPMAIGKNLALLAVLIDLIQRSVIPMKDLANKISTLQRVFTGIERVTEFQKDLRPLDVMEHNTSLEFVFHKIEFNIDKFIYKNRHNDIEEKQREDFFLHPVHFFLKKGESLGIAGRSGAGKTTLVKILTLQLYSPNSYVTFWCKDQPQKINFNSQEDLLFYAKQICIVSQESHLFSTSIFFNITLSHDLNNEFSHFWLEMIKLIPYLKTWNISPETRINPQDLSFGQRQLIGALRAIYLKRPIIIFDEISAGMDKALESSLYSLMTLMMTETATIVIAHRLETIIRCNNILLMDKGKVEDYGTHRELMQRSNLYKSYLNEAEEF